MAGLDLESLFPPKPCYDTMIPAWRHHINYEDPWYLGLEVLFFLLSAKVIHCTFIISEEHEGLSHAEPNHRYCLTNRGPCGSSLPWNSHPWLFYHLHHLHMFQGAYSYLHSLFFCPSCNLTAKWRCCLAVFAGFPISLLSQRINHLWSIITSVLCCLCLHHNSSVCFSTASGAIMFYPISVTLLLYSRSNCNFKQQ